MLHLVTQEISAADFTLENANVIVQYADIFTGGDVSSSEQVLPGCGAIMRDGLHKLAIYRDSDRAVHTFSASCPHLGCIVAWNFTEKTWDCTCHSSRFGAHGEVVNGPALTGLGPSPT